MSNSDSFDGAALIESRAARLRAVMRARGVPALLTSHPINILYACGARNMTVFSLMGPFRMALIFADGPSILYEFAGCEHLADGRPGVDQVRPAPGLTALSGAGYLAGAARFAAEIADLCRSHGDGATLAIEGFDPPVSDALRAQGLHLGDATALLSEARLIKTPLEIATMRQAVALVQDAAADLEDAITPGASEVEVWAAFHRHLIATEGEYVSTRLFQSSPRTFPYFQEAGPRRMQAGDLVCFDTDALGWQGYAVDFSRSFLCGDARPARCSAAFMPAPMTSCKAMPRSWGQVSAMRLSPVPSGPCRQNTRAGAIIALPMALAYAENFPMCRTPLPGNLTISPAVLNPAW